MSSLYSRVEPPPIRGDRRATLRQIASEIRAIGKNHHGYGGGAGEAAGRLLAMALKLGAFSHSKWLRWRTVVMAPLEGDSPRGFQTALFAAFESLANRDNGIAESVGVEPPPWPENKSVAILLWACEGVAGLIEREADAAPAAPSSIFRDRREREVFELLSRPFPRATEDYKLPDLKGNMPPMPAGDRVAAIVPSILVVAWMQLQASPAPPQVAEALFMTVRQYGAELLGALGKSAEQHPELRQNAIALMEAIREWMEEGTFLVSSYHRWDDEFSPLNLRPATEIDPTAVAKWAVKSDGLRVRIQSFSDAVPGGLFPAEPIGETNTETDQGSDYITLDQAAALVNRSKKTLERRLEDMPPPDVEGGGGKPHEWDYRKLKLWLETEFGKRLPDRPPHTIR